MDGQRGYPDSTEPRWYGSSGSYGEGDWGGRGADYPEQQRTDPAYRPADAPSYDDQGRFPDQAPGARYDSARAGGEPGQPPYGQPVSGAHGQPVSGAHGQPVSGAYGQPVSGADAVGQPASATTVPGQPTAPYGQPVSGAPGQPAAAGYGQPGAAQADPGRVFHTQPIERPGQRRDQPADAVPGSVYRTRRPAAAVVIAAVVLVFELVTLRIFATATLASPIRTQGAIGGMFLFVGLPLFAYGLYALITGAAVAGAGARPWLRTPLAYLPIGLALLVCAALAAA